MLINPRKSTSRLKVSIFSVAVFHSHRVKPSAHIWTHELNESERNIVWVFFVFQVAKVNPKDSSYLLRDDFYKHVQRDWPGYSEEERQLISRLLARWVRGTCCIRRICHLRWYNEIKKFNLNICLYSLFVSSNKHRLAFPLLSSTKSNFLFYQSDCFLMALFRHLSSSFLSPPHLPLSAPHISVLELINTPVCTRDTQNLFHFQLH